MEYKSIWLNYDSNIFGDLVTKSCKSMTGPMIGSDGYKNQCRIKLMAQ